MIRRDFFSALFTLPFMALPSVPETNSSGPRMLGNAQCSCGWIMMAIFDGSIEPRYICTNQSCPNYQQKYKMAHLPLERA